MIREWFRYDSFLLGHEMTATEIEKALTFDLCMPEGQSMPLFEGLLETQTQIEELKKKISQHARMIRVARGEKLYSADRYTNTVYYVIRGSALVGPKDKSKKGILKRFLGKYKNQAIRDSEDKVEGTEEHVSIPSGHLLGLSGTLDRVKQSADIYAETDMVLLEIRWHLLYHILCNSKNFTDYIAFNFILTTMYCYLRSISWFQYLDTRSMKTIVQNAEFTTYGSSNWFRAKHKPEMIIDQESPVNALYVLWAGFASVMRQTHHGYELLSMIRRHSVFGLQTIFKGIGKEVGDETKLWQKCMQSMGYTKVIVIPAKIIEEILIPNLPKKLIKKLLKERTTKGMSISNQDDKLEKFNLEMSFQAGAMEFIQENLFLNGRQGMLINLDRCTRCFDCVTACSNLHDGNAVFSWHGTRYENFAISNACMHCVDPVCMVECPTGAISRSGDDASVQINTDTCIGCGACAQACPYNNISMLEVHKSSSEEQGTHDMVTRTVATKCDLCKDEEHGPACQLACPQEALIRTDMADMVTLSKWVKR